MAGGRGHLPEKYGKPVVFRHKGMLYATSGTWGGRGRPEGYLGVFRYDAGQEKWLRQGDMGLRHQHNVFLSACAVYYDPVN